MSIPRTSQAYGFERHYTNIERPHSCMQEVWQGSYRSCRQWHFGRECSSMYNAAPYILRLSRQFFPFVTSSASITSSAISFSLPFSQTTVLMLDHLLTHFSQLVAAAAMILQLARLQPHVRRPHQNLRNPQSRAKQMELAKTSMST